MRIVDYGILAVIAALVVLAVGYLVRRKKRGCVGCSGGCASCGLSCARKDENKKR